MTAEVISVGTELLLGQIVNTNEVYLSQRLALLGVAVIRRVTVGDDAAQIAQAVRSAWQQSDCVLITGGLGPTPDDVTALGIAQGLNVPLVRSPEAAAWLTDLLRQRGIQPNPTLLKQADLPEGATWLPNPVGTAPGIWVEREGKVLAALPGVPAEMEAMFEQEVVPRLKARLRGGVLRWRVLRFVGIGESALTDRLKDWNFNESLSFGTLVKPGEVWLRLMAKASSEEEAIVLLNEAEAAVRERVGEWLFAVGEEPLEEMVGNALKERQWSIATAESVTGGLVCATLIKVPGSSAYVRGGVVAYEDSVKMHLLGVPWEVLQTEGAVSESCARWMAIQVRSRLKAHVGVATTGYAGPTGGEPEKPIGTVFIAVSTPIATVVERYQLRGTRQQIRERATALALIQTLRTLTAGKAP